MENIAQKNRTVYEYLDTQTVSQRKEFVKQLQANGINATNIRNWIAKRAAIPEKYHSLVSQIAGQTLAFPKLVRKVFIESEA